MFNKLFTKWDIVSPTFSMWTDGKREQPSITYTKLNDLPLTVNNQVKFLKDGKEKTIEGIEKYKDGQFIWRGKGLLKIFKSTWHIVYLDDDILNIKFGSTLITEAGLDILVRDKSRSEELKEKILQSPEDYKLTEENLEQLEWLV